MMDMNMSNMILLFVFFCAMLEKAQEMPLVKMGSPLIFLSLKGVSLWPRINHRHRHRNRKKAQG